MTKQNDDLEAVRIIAEALKDFEKNDQERIIRWARERVGLDLVSVQPARPVVPDHQQAVPISKQLEGQRLSNIKNFVDAKAPKNDIHFAATVAYYYRFEAPDGNRKENINSEDLQDACRLAGRDRFKKPIMVLANAHTTGLLDRGSERGSYSINAVGENLVAMTLPITSGASARSSRRKGKGSKKRTTGKNKR